MRSYILQSELMCPRVQCDLKWASVPSLPGSKFPRISQWGGLSGPERRGSGDLCIRTRPGCHQDNHSLVDRGKGPWAAIVTLPAVVASIIATPEINILCASLQAYTWTWPWHAILTLDSFEPVSDIFKSFSGGAICNQMHDTSESLQVV